MDDYGMGSSTLKQLHEIRFDILKPDWQSESGCDPSLSCGNAVYVPLYYARGGGAAPGRI